MHKTELNGFSIEKYNQYNLDNKAGIGICPLCSSKRKPKNRKLKCASYDWKIGIGTCHNCNSSFQLHTYKRKKNILKDYIKPPKKEITGLSDKALKWFLNRGISEKTLKDLKITEGIEFMPQTNKKVNTIHFNYFIENELVNVKYRDGAKNFKLHKGAEKIFYNIDSIVDYESCIIVEGEMDVLALHESGLENVISVPNGATLNKNNLDYLDNCIDYFEDKNHVIIATDTDEPGKALQSELIRRLGAEKCYTVDFEDVKDANEYLLKHGKEKLVQCIAGAKAVPLENVITFNDVKGDLIDFVENGFKPGYQVGLEEFDKIFSTYTKQFITVTGIPSSGKSDFVDQMAVGYNLKYGWKIAYASPENQPEFLHIHKLMRKFWKGMPSKEDIGTLKWNSFSEHINENFFHITMERFNLDDVLSKGAELVKRKGIKCLVIDPFNKVRDLSTSSEDVNMYTLEYLAKVDIFAKKHDLLVILVAHPTKMYKDKNGKMEEPTMYNIKGGGEWYDASYHGLLVHRNYENNTVKVKVLKCKFQNLGENGAEAHFKWNVKSGIYETIEAPPTNMLPWE